MERKRTVHGTFLVVGLAVLHVGGALGLLGAWSLATTSSAGGADIGGGIAIMFGTALFAIGLLLELVALVVWASRRRVPVG